jgi:hypothetical protein
MENEIYELGASWLNGQWGKIFRIIYFEKIIILPIKKPVIVPYYRRVVLCAVKDFLENMGVFNKEESFILPCIY